MVGCGTESFSETHWYQIRDTSQTLPIIGHLTQLKYSALGKWPQGVRRWGGCASQLVSHSLSEVLPITSSVLHQRWIF